MPKQVNTYITLKVKEEKYTHTPTAPINQIAMGVFANDSLSNMMENAKAKNLLRKDNEYDILRDKNNKDVFVLRKETNNNIFELSIKGCNIDENNPDVLFGGRIGAQYMYVFLLQKMNSLSADGNVYFKSISFRLDEFVKNGRYSTPNSARKGVKDGLDLLLNMSFTMVRKDKNGKAKEEIVGVRPYRNYIIKNGEVTVNLETEFFNWRIFLDKFTVLPNYFYRLSSKAGLLLYLIFGALRQNYEKLSAVGHININLGRIANDIGLPQLDEKLKDPKSKILKRITDSVDEILKQDEINGSRDLVLNVIYPEKKTVKEILTNGYLEISLRSGGAKGYFEEISRDREKKINEKKKLKDKAKAKALANFELNKLEKEAGQN